MNYYICDPEKNKDCTKESCQTLCFHTTNENFRKQEMTLKEFEEAIDKEPVIRDYLVKIKLKYKNEPTYRYINELLLVTPTSCTYEWANDWFEGEEDVRIVDYKAIEDIQL